MNIVEVVVSLLLVLYLCEQISTKQLRIVHYNNVTLSTCGLNAFSAKPHQKRCFKWHQTILEQKLSLRNIKGGRYAEYGEFPYTVLIKGFGNNNPMCTAAIINEQWIITAAHCLRESDTDIEIYSGVTDYPEYSLPSIDKNNFYVHENYTKDDDYRNDIALIKLNTKIDININTANSVCLPSPAFMLDLPKELAILTGWGRFNANETNRIRLKMTRLELGNVLYDSTLKKIWSLDDKYGFACTGDSGGPLVQYVNNRAVLIGVHSTITPAENPPKRCGKIRASSFTAVPYYLKWIIDTIRNN